MKPVLEKPSDAVLAPPAADAVTIAAGAFINFVGTLAKLVKSVSVLVLTRLYGAEVFGLYMLTWTMMDVVGKVGNFALDRGLVNFIPRFHGDGKREAIHRTIAQALGFGVILSAVVGAILYFGASLLAQNLLNKPEMTDMLRMFAFAMPAMTITTILLGVAKAHKVMKFDAIAKGGVEPLILFSAASALFFLGWETFGIVGGHVLALIASLFFMTYAFTRFYSWRDCLAHLGKLKIRSRLIRFSLPVMGYELIYLLMIRLDVLMVGYFLPAMEVGIYVVAM